MIDYDYIERARRLSYEPIERASRLIAETVSPLKDVAKVLETMKKAYLIAGPLAGPQQRRVLEAIDNRLRVYYRVAALTQKCTGSIRSKAQEALSPRSHTPAEEVYKAPVVSPPRSQGREQSPPTSIHCEVVVPELAVFILEDAVPYDLRVLDRQVGDVSRPVNDRLELLTTKIPMAAHWTARKLAKVLRCDHSVVVRTRWWIDNRKYRVAARIEERRGRLVARREVWD